MAMNRTPRILAIASAVVLLATAAFHATGHPAISQAVSAGVSGFWRRVIPRLWLFFSWHLAALALASAWAGFRGHASARPLVAFCALVTVADTGYVYSMAGAFPGTFMLAGAALGLVFASLRWTRV
jgi:hypothetical protein